MQLKKKTVIFGAGGTGKTLYKKLLNDQNYEVFAFLDNDSSKHGTKLFDLPILSPAELSKLAFDIIVIASLCGQEPLFKQLVEECNVNPTKIDSNYVTLRNKSRLHSLTNTASLMYAYGVKGSVAELGVFQGEFAKEINRLFPDRTFYLFDTFEGFDEKDLELEKNLSNAEKGHLNITSEQLVLDKLPNRDNCIVKKGYFPETLGNLEDMFCFVNLDPDLYKPILEGLRYFFPRLAPGGVIFVHDYFSDEYPGVKQAIRDFQAEYNISIVPIGDDCTVAITNPSKPIAII